MKNQKGSLFLKQLQTTVKKLKKITNTYCSITIELDSFTTGTEKINYDLWIGLEGKTKHFLSLEDLYDHTNLYIEERKNENSKSNRDSKSPINV